MQDINKFSDLDNIITQEHTNIAGIAVYQNGHTLYERYFNGHTKEDTIHIASATKSILSLLVGIAVDQGYIVDVEQKVLGFFPDYKIKRGEKTVQTITIRDILTMTAPYKYKHEPYTKVYSSDDWTKAALDLLGGKGPVGAFKYSTVGAHILSGVLTNAAKMPLSEFAAVHLFKPLKIETPENVAIENKEAYMSFIKGTHAKGWVADPKGINTGGWGLTLKLVDMLKIGQLCLNNGMWDKQQIVSKDWIKESTETHSRFNDLPYGYLWWIIKDSTGQAYAALGDGGNVIFICPSKGIVVAIACDFKPRAKDSIAFIKENILSKI